MWCVSSLIWSNVGIDRRNGMKFMVRGTVGPCVMESAD
jgi:hypothetical protein